ncbi:hypothetical protein [Streptomyces bugieae]|uniref:Uncharacterized protein n=1 Tax=Streptomyces bugieae TaxID=3098223 RepID=A0ABU7NKY4_9ACTN|nr:hypothetical protein [Streptomyces sp. DSM 41528]
MAAVTTDTSDEALAAQARDAIAQYEVDIANIHRSIASMVGSGQRDKATEIFTLERIAAERQQRIDRLHSLI